MSVNLENIMLSERKQMQKITYCMVPFIGKIQNRQIQDAESRLIISRAGEGGVESDCSQVEGYQG